MLTRYRLAGAGPALAAILLIAVALRLWGINFGLPYLYHPDEPGYVAIAQNMVKTGDLNPHFFNYPTLFFYLNSLAYLPFYAVGRVLGVFQTPADIPAPILLVGGAGMTPLAATFWLGRLLTLAFGTGAVMLVYLVGRQLFGSRRVGLLAALLLAISPTNVTHSRYITPDTFVVFFAVFSLWAAVRVYQRGRTRDYVLAGVMAGLTAATKYNGALILICIVATHFLRAGWRGWRDRRLYLAIAASALAFAFATPFAIFDPAKFMADLSLEARHYATGHAGGEGNAALWYVTYLWQAEGLTALFALAALARGLWMRTKPVIVVAAFPVAYFVFISNFMVRNDRTLVPLTPFLFLLAALFLVHAWDWLYRREPGPDIALPGTRPPWARGVAGLLLALTLLIPLTGTIQGANRLTTVDSRETARVWIAQNLPPGARVVLESYAPYVDPQRFTVLGVYRLILYPPAWYINEKFDYLVFSEGMFKRFYLEPDKYAAQIAEYEALFQAFEPIKIFTDGGYEVRIYRIMAH
ncbi:MAG: glycosyltransferase family 39 protein [Anaerolineae bacterium]